MVGTNSHSAQITHDNTGLSKLKLSWATMEFTPDDGMGSMGSLHEAGDSIIAISRIEDEGITIIGSGVMVAPGLLLTATHVLDEFKASNQSPVLLTFLPGFARIWIPRESSSVSGESKFGNDRRTVSDISLVSCTLNSEAYDHFPLMLAPMQVALPQIGERLWAFGYRHQRIEDETTSINPIVSSGLVTAVFPHGRGEHLPSPCLQVEMDTLGGMSGGPVVNDEGYLIGIVSSSFEGGPSFITLIWDALRYNIKGTVPLLSQREEVNLLYAKYLGLAKIKGAVRRRPWGDVVLTMTDEEMNLFIESSPPELINQKKISLNGDQLDKFVDDWGSEIEAVAQQAAIQHLEELSLDSMRKYLMASNVPLTCLEYIREFSVDDFEGLEDPEILSTELRDNSNIEIEYYFNLRSVIWMVEVEEQVYRTNASNFDTHFMNVEIKNETARMEIIQRCFFKAKMTFDSSQNTFMEVTINWSGVRELYPPNTKLNYI